MVLFLDCYNRNEHTSMRFVPNNIDNPDDFDIKSYVNIKSNKCYCEKYKSLFLLYKNKE